MTVRKWHNDVFARGRDFRRGWQRRAVVGGQSRSPVQPGKGLGQQGDGNEEPSAVQLGRDDVNAAAPSDRWGGSASRLRSAAGVGQGEALPCGFCFVLARLGARGVASGAGSLQQPERFVRRRRDPAPRGNARFYGIFSRAWGRVGFTALLAQWKA